MKKINFFIFGLNICMGLLLVACGPSSTKENTRETTAGEAATPKAVFEDIDVPAFRKMMTADNAVVLDVRTPAETQMGMIDGAVAIDISQAGFKEKIGQLDKSKIYLVYCKAGSRSSRACEIMAEAGFEHVFNLEGGYMAWEQQK